MRILFCNYEYPPLGGGGGILNAALAQELAKRHEVTVLTSQASGMPQQSRQKGVRILRVPVHFRKQKATASNLSMLMYMLRGPKIGAQLLRMEQFDIINTHFALPSGPVGEVLAKKAQIPNILSIHGGDLYDPSKWTSPHRHWILRCWVQKLLRSATFVVGQSQNTLNNMKQYYTPQLKGHLIPLGISRPSSGIALRKNYGFKKDDIILVTIGRLIARKAIDQLITLMASLQNKQTKLRLLIIGTGPQEDQLKNEAIRKKCNDTICFVDHVTESEKYRLLRMSDIYVSTSQHEGFGLVFLEAMACGLPIVCYDYGGQTDFLEDGRTGYLVPLNNLKKFEERLDYLTEDRKIWEEIKTENKKRVEQLYIDQCAARYEALFEKAIQQQKTI